ncbi:MAG: hypothetical protein GC190_16640 [Alphaproteobacteria bacterium]|nr:hypothetical protein [Alphaproteobacteria bacterium]
MLATAIIVFREVFEAALIISIVAAATASMPGRNRWLALGILGGVIGAIAVALFAGQIAQLAQGVGQELLNASVLFLAVLMLGWHNVWMQSHGRELASEMSAVGRAVSSGARPMYAIAIAVGLAVLREGSEVVLFLYGIASGGTGAASLLVGGLLGLAAGAAIGLAIYAGLLRLATRYLFATTSWLILLVAAGLASQGANFLVQAGLLPALGNAIWDTSAILSEQSLLGQTLHVLVGYVAQPSGIQLVFYAATLLAIGGTMIIFNHPKTAMRASSAVLVAVALPFLFAKDSARAADKIYTPYVEYRELEIEYRGTRTFDGDSALDNGQSHKLAIGYGFTEYWASEVYAQWKRDPGGETAFDAFEWENKFQITEPGEYWADFGALVEWEHNDPHDPDEVEVRLLFNKDISKFSNTLNLTFVKELGDNSAPGVSFEYGARVSYRLDQMFEPAVEAFGEMGEIGSFPAFDRQSHQIGPAILGTVPIPGGATKLKYNVGYFVGVSDDAPQGEFKLELEFEVPLG